MQEFGIDRGTTTLAVAVFQLCPHKLRADVLVDESQQMSPGTRSSRPK
jgi:hypothetical protein